MISRRQFTKNTVTLAFMGLGSSLLGCASTPVGNSNAMGMAKSYGYGEEQWL
ncbi:hypothetical protein [Pseudoalteromonas sp. MMG012]|uniref:hypothetical protein n=1 Tax=Pseudoalteromonas sp. MMG012 TaxID=2822686 RepID=UPI001B39DCD4|nr:hypothetical protein [Pseudoalteromonas sp. MMG012]MBQ4852660.1 hypothetical protein [Pseudoalteromonas sp. MMG012]